MVRKLWKDLKKKYRLKFLVSEMLDHTWGRLRIRTIMYAKEFCRVLYHYKLA